MLFEKRKKCLILKLHKNEKNTFNHLSDILYFSHLM